MTTSTIGEVSIFDIGAGRAVISMPVFLEGIELQMGGVPRPGDMVIHDGREWYVGAVTWTDYDGVYLPNLAAHRR